LALDTFRTQKLRFILTAVGMMIGTTSLILVVTVGLTGKRYVLDQIQGLGANLIYATYEGEGGNGSKAQDYLTVDDVHAVQQQVPGVVAASPMLTLHERIPVQGGKEQDVLVLGVDPQYGTIRKLNVLAGRFFDALDDQSRGKVATLTESLAKRLYAGQDAAIGRSLRISGLPFTVIGTFKEGVETFGQSEISGDTILIPYRVSRYFTADNKVHQLFFSMADPAEIQPATAIIKSVLQRRHHPESVYRVDNLTQLLVVAANAANALSAVLLLVSLITLLVSGVGIMNIMLATVTARTHEIGIRKAVGATAGEIKSQFLAEAILVSLTGGVIGIGVGLALPFSLRLLEYNIPVSWISVAVAFGASSLVGILFGTAPATRAAKLDPITSLQRE
jgi:putative ABC transport system permease protein